MKILILSNWSWPIAEMNDLTAPNKAAYAQIHGYDFTNLKIPYEAEMHIHWLRVLAEKLENYDAIMTIGCDAIFVNQSVKIEDRMSDRNGDHRVSIAKDLTCCWPIQINNDVMIWPKGLPAMGLIDRLIKDCEIWLKYPQLWQNHLWNLICSEETIRNSVRLVEPRLMNATFQPMTRAVTETEEILGSWERLLLWLKLHKPKKVKQSRLTRIPGNSSYALGDWIFHALDMPLGDKIQVLKWAMQYVGDGSWTPDKGEIAERVEL